MKKFTAKQILAEAAQLMPDGYVLEQADEFAWCVRQLSDNQSEYAFAMDITTGQLLAWDNDGNGMTPITGWKASVNRALGGFGLHDDKSPRTRRPSRAKPLLVRTVTYHRPGTAWFDQGGYRWSVVAIGDARMPPTPEGATIVSDEVEEHPEGYFRTAFGGQYAPTVHGGVRFADEYDSRGSHNGTAAWSDERNLARGKANWEAKFGKRMREGFNSYYDQQWV